MPTYDYKCTQCGYDFEMFQSMSEDHIKKCPECEGIVRRLVGGGSGLIFKGSGFYLTDYGKGKDQKKKADGQNGKEKKTTKTDKTKEKKTENKKSE
jgi:putative FmdB family regulatory protein